MRGTNALCKCTFKFIIIFYIKGLSNSSYLKFFHICMWRSRVEIAEKSSFNYLIFNVRLTYLFFKFFVWYCLFLCIGIKHTFDFLLFLVSVALMLSNEIAFNINFVLFLLNVSRCRFRTILTFCIKIQLFKINFVEKSTSSNPSSLFVFCLWNAHTGQVLIKMYRL